MGREHGLAAVISLLVIFAFGFAIRTLWNKNQELHNRLLAQETSAKELTDDHAVQLREMSDEHLDQLNVLAEQHAADRKNQADEYTRQLLAMSNRMNDLQERRVEETRKVTEKVITYIGHIDRFANKLEATIDILIRAGERR